MNAFIDYLNSMHNSSGDSLGALAERQIQSSYSPLCHVSRRLGKIIAGQIRDGVHAAYIITGHAGDGKTSILVQVLRELGMIRPGELLEREKNCSGDNGDLYYVKDMSEVRLEQRVTYLRKALHAPLRKMSSILISNTGPLLSTFEDLLKSDCEQAGETYDEMVRRANQTELLDQLDTNHGTIRTIGGYSFYMINIARIDNVSFAQDFLTKILNDDLWKPCEDCQKKANCPVRRNYEHVKHNEGRVATFINAYLRYTYEFDQRLTIRQIQAQLCYALTGGITCKDIVPYRSYSSLKYGFPNLFFGYGNNEANDAALKMKAIRVLHDLNLDAAALPIDYDLFVKGRTDFFPEDIRAILEAEILPDLKKLNRSSDDEVRHRNQKAIALRKSLRRYYLMFGDASQDEIFDCVFGKGFSLYEDVAAHAGLPKPKLNRIRDTIFNALYLNNTGFLPHTSSDHQVPLTLHRKDGMYQSVMLVLGHVSKGELGIFQRAKGGYFEDDQTRQRVILETRGHSFDISLPLFLYFVRQSCGAVTTVSNPALTHNIARLETLLADVFKNPENSDIELLINTTKGQQYQRLYINEDKIHLD